METEQQSNIDSFESMSQEGRAERLETADTVERETIDDILNRGRERAEKAGGWFRGIKERVSGIFSKFKGGVKETAVIALAAPDLAAYGGAKTAKKAGEAGTAILESGRRGVEAVSTKSKELGGRAAQRLKEAKDKGIDTYEGIVNFTQEKSAQADAKFREKVNDASNWSKEKIRQIKEGAETGWYKTKTAFSNWLDRRKSDWEDWKREKQIAKLATQKEDLAGKVARLEALVARIPTLKEEIRQIEATLSSLQGA